MASTQTTPAGPDFTLGVPAKDVSEGRPLLGHVGGEPVLLTRLSNEFFAISAACTHYGGPLAEGLIVGDTVRCPWHHACFNLRTGEALRAPAFSPVACWSVEQHEGRLIIRSKKDSPRSARESTAAGRDAPGRIVIVGGGATGFAAAEQLRRADYQGEIVMLSDDDVAPVDRPNLSKDYLAGTAPEEWVPLRGPEFYAEQNIDLRLGAKVSGIDVRAREVSLAAGGKVAYDRLLLATGAEPMRLPIPGADLPHVYTLRSFSDCKAIIERAKVARRAVVIGASFIGLEVTASLLTRGIEVHVVAPERRPMERILGPEIGDLVKRLHTEHGAVFHLENTVVSIETTRVTLKDGAVLEADIVVMGVGVRPRIQLAEQAGLAVDRGVAVNEFLETSAPDVFAAGDIARWPDPYSGENIRVEHWVVAERQGQAAARNMLGARENYADVPFFWSQHYDVPINYVGHAQQWDELAIEGDVAAKDCLVRFKKAGRVLAAASIQRDLQSLEVEAMMERGGRR